MRRWERLTWVALLVLVGCAATAERDTMTSSSSANGSDDGSDGAGPSDGNGDGDGDGQGGDGMDQSDAGVADGNGGDGTSTGSDGTAADMADAGSGDGTDTTPPGDTGVPAGDHCAPVASWDAQWTQFEEEVLVLTNEARAKGHNCDTEGNFGPAGPLAMEAHLRCSARLHSQYMAMSGDFDHTESANGSDPFQRIMATGYSFRGAGENIAAGQTTPQEVVNGWLDSDGHCRNIMEPSFTQIGIGYVPGTMSSPWGGGSTAYPYWTQNFATPF